jgi:hypothetical protein
VALVELSDGTFIQTAKSVKVTIGGCGWFLPNLVCKAFYIGKM